MTQQPDPVHRGLSPREQEIIVLIASGETLDTTAHLLECSYHTVKSHIVRIYAKLGVNSLAAMVGKAVHFGMVNLEGVYPSIEGPQLAPPGYVEKNG